MYQLERKNHGIQVNILFQTLYKLFLSVICISNIFHGEVTVKASFHSNNASLKFSQ